MMHTFTTSSQTADAGKTSRRPFQPKNFNSPEPASKNSKKSLSNINNNIISNKTSTFSTSKPKLPVINTTLDTQSKLSVLSENDSEWRTLNKQGPANTSSTSIDSSETSKVVSSNNRPGQVFVRRRADSIDDEVEDMLVLKRANPVYDSDDEDDLVFSPSKRQRTGESTILSWGDRLDDDQSFLFNESSLLSH